MSVVASGSIALCNCVNCAVRFCSGSVVRSWWNVCVCVGFAERWARRVWKGRNLKRLPPDGEGFRDFIVRVKSGVGGGKGERGGGGGDVLGGAQFLSVGKRVREKKKVRESQRQTNQQNQPKVYSIVYSETKKKQWDEDTPHDINSPHPIRWRTRYVKYAVGRRSVHKNRRRKMCNPKRRRIIERKGRRRRKMGGGIVIVPCRGVEMQMGKMEE